MTAPSHGDVLFLIVQYLQATGLFASSLTVQQESGLDVSWLRGSSRELALLRRWVFGGDVERARALLQPLHDLDIVPDELTVAEHSLKELELLLKSSNKDPSRLARSKLECFEKVVPLFRERVNSEESDVYKYVVMPKLQLAGLVKDAVIFHNQNGNSIAKDCISVECAVSESSTVDDKENAKILFLDKPQDQLVNYPEDISIKSNFLARSVDLASRNGERHNPMASSVVLSKMHSRYEADRFDCEWETQHEKIVETADVAVDCNPDSLDAGVYCKPESLEVAVNCKPMTKNIGADCRPDTVSVSVGREFEFSCDASMQTEAITWPEDEGGRAYGHDFVKDNQIEQEIIDNDAEPQDILNEQFVDHLSSSRLSAVTLPSSSHNHENSRFLPSDFSKSFASKNPLSHIDPENQDGDKWKNNVDVYDLPPDKAVARDYSDLTLDDIVRACVVAEAKEPQAVRALDIHPSGDQMVVGTNARALRVFDLPRPTEQHQQLSSSSHLTSILPLLPVAFERHKYHSSGIYCASFNHFLSENVGLASMIASGAADGSVKVLICHGKGGLRRQQVEEISVRQGDPNGSMGKVRALEFASPSHLWIASTHDRRLHCYDVHRTRKKSSCGPIQTLDGHVGEVQAIAMPDPTAKSSLILSAALDKTVRLWDTRSGRCEHLVTSGASAAFSLHFHPTDQRMVASSHQDGSVALWDLRSASHEALQVLVPHDGECRSVRWSPDGRWLLSAGFDGSLCVLQTSSLLSSLMAMQPVASYHQHQGKVLQAQWHPTEPAMVSTGADKRVKLWAFA